MKNFLQANYNINVKKIMNKNGKTFFFYNNLKVFIEKYNGDLNKLDYLIRLTNELYYYKINVNTFIMNNVNQFYTKYKDYYIVLMKENEYLDEVSLIDLKKFEVIKNNLYNYNVYNEWQKEIDIIEKEIIEYNKEFNKIQGSIDYYIGRGETAIELISEFDNIIDDNNNSVGHLLDFKLYGDNSINNPFTFIKVNKMYDIANYIKYKFYKNEFDFEFLNTIIENCNKMESIYLFSCLMYPGEFFDLVKKVLLKEENEEKIDFYIKRIKNYNNLLIYCQKSVNQKNHIKIINWL